MPKWLSAESRKVWKSLAPHLERLGVLTKIDVMTFASLCETFARYRKARAVVNRLGFTYKTKGGMIRKRPEMEIMTQAEKELRHMSVEFGLTPSSRTRLAAGFAGGQLPLFGGQDPDGANSGGDDDAREVFGF